MPHGRGLGWDADSRPPLHVKQRAAKCGGTGLPGLPAPGRLRFLPRPPILFGDSGVRTQDTPVPSGESASELAAGSATPDRPSVHCFQRIPAAAAPLPLPTSLWPGTFIYLGFFLLRRRSYWEAPRSPSAATPSISPSNDGGGQPGSGPSVGGSAPQGGAK